MRRCQERYVLGLGSVILIQGRIIRFHHSALMSLRAAVPQPNARVSPPLLSPPFFASPQQASSETAQLSLPPTLSLPLLPTLAKKRPIPNLEAAPHPLHHPLRPVPQPSELPLIEIHFVRIVGSRHEGHVGRDDDVGSLRLEPDKEE